MLDAKGRILTAEHVVEGAQSIKVKFQDGTTRKGKLLGKDSASDIALLRVDPSGLTLHPLRLGSVESLRVGDALFLVGDPFGYARSLSTGVVWLSTARSRPPTASRSPTRFRPTRR